MLVINNMNKSVSHLIPEILQTKITLMAYGLNPHPTAKLIKDYMIPKILCDDKKINGTCSSGAYIHTTINNIMKVFGEAHAYDIDCGKIQYEWRMILTDGSVFTIYDWKEDIFHHDEVIEFHVGCHTPNIKKVITVLSHIFEDMRFNNYHLNIGRDFLYHDGEM